MMKIRVLVFPAEGHNATEIHDALSSCVNVEVWGASSVARHGAYVFENYWLGLPNVSDDSFYDAFAALIIELGIDVVFPTHDTVVWEFACNRGRIPARVMVPSLETARACRWKSVAYGMLEGFGFVPRVYVSPKEVDSFPVFAKPDDGQGGRGARVVRTSEELVEVDFSRDVVTEYLPGYEFTVDCLTDSHGELRCILPRRRARVENGVSARAETFNASEEVMDIAHAINGCMEFRGLWFFQLRRSADGVLKLMEVSGRCAGTMGASRAKGYNLPLLSTYVAMGLDIDVLDNGYEVVADRALEAVCDLSVPVRRVFLDYDDTLIMGDLVNLDAIRLVYQCRNKGIPVVLLTRHDGSLEESMEGHGIPATLFERIVHLAPSESKTSHVGSEHGDVFIDNAFAERRAVHSACGIPVFDVSEIPVLLDRKRLGKGGAVGTSDAACSVD